MKAFVERQLKKVFGAKAHDPDYETMTGMERADAQSAMRQSGEHERSRIVADSADAGGLARAANERSGAGLRSELVDDGDEAATLANAASEHDGSHLADEIKTDENADAGEEAAEASHHEAPRSELVDDSDGAIEDARRASHSPDEDGEAAAEGDTGADENADRRRGEAT